MFWCITSTILKRTIQTFPNCATFSDVQTSPPATMGMQMFDDIMKNVQKELQEQVHKGKNSQPLTSLQRNIQSRPSMRSDKPWAVELDSLRAKLPSAKSCSWNSVSNSLTLLFSYHSSIDSAPEDAKCYKILGPVLLDQTLAQSKENIVKRGDLLNNELNK